MYTFIVDVMNTAVRTPSMPSGKVVVTVANELDIARRHLGVSHGFIQGDLDYDLHMRLSQGCGVDRF